MEPTVFFRIIAGDDYSREGDYSREAITKVAYLFIYLFTDFSTPATKEAEQVRCVLIQLLNY